MGRSSSRWRDTHTQGTITVCVWFTNSRAGSWSTGRFPSNSLTRSPQRWANSFLLITSLPNYQKKLWLPVDKGTVLQAGWVTDREHTSPEEVARWCVSRHLHLADYGTILLPCSCLYLSLKKKRMTAEGGHFYILIYEALWMGFVEKFSYFFPSSIIFSFLSFCLPCLLTSWNIADSFGF